MSFISPALVAAASIFTMAFAAGDSPEPASDRIFTPPGFDVAFRNDAAIGYQASYGFCPCLKWTVQVKLLNGEIETSDFLISTDALFEMQQTLTTRWQMAELETFKLGALEVLYKGGHVGLGFDGVTLGKDSARGYSEILRTGLYFLVNLFRTDMTRMDVDTGYHHEQLTINEGLRASRNIVDASVLFRVGRPDSRIQSRIEGKVRYDVNGPAAEKFSYEARGSVQGDIVKFKDFVLGAGFQASYQYDPFLESIGLNPHLGVAGIYIDVGFVVPKTHVGGGK